MQFTSFCERYFARLVTGYAAALDDSLVRAWLPGHTNWSDAKGAWDATTRSLPAMCAWLSDPSRPRAVSYKGRTANVERLVTAVFENAFDPGHPAFWGKEEFPRLHQMVVESSMLAYGAWLVRDTVLPKLSKPTLQRFIAWLEYFGEQAYPNNWQLFLIVNQAARKALGFPHDAAVVARGWEVINSYERDGGFMTDGPDHHFDDYQWWVFGTHELFWLQMDGASDPALSERIRNRTRARLGCFPHLFGANGAYTEYGRSLSYKFARLGTPLLAYPLGLWPHSPGMLQRLTRRHLAHYDHIGGIDRVSDTVRQELSAHGHPDVREPYINTGHPYWAMHAFAALWQIPSDDPFWTVDEEPLPAEGADYRLPLAAANWLVTGAKSSGQAARYTMGTHKGAGTFAAKYSKFAYASHFPFNVAAVDGDFGPDSALCLTDGVHWAHPTVYGNCVTTADAIRARYTLRVGDHDVAVETVLAPLGDGQRHLRVHRIESPVAVTAFEGAFALGYDSAASLTKHTSSTVSAALAADYTSQRLSWIAAVQGYTRAVAAHAWRNRDNTNLAHYRNVVPMLEAAIPQGVSTLACVVGGEVGIHRVVPDRVPTVEIAWERDGRLSMHVDGADIRIPPLP